MSPCSCTPRGSGKRLGGGGEKHSPFAFCSALVIVVKGGGETRWSVNSTSWKHRDKNFPKEIVKMWFFFHMPMCDFYFFVFTEIWVRTSSSPFQGKPSEEPQTSKICECPFSRGESNIMRKVTISKPPWRQYLSNKSKKTMCPHLRFKTE